LVFSKRVGEEKEGATDCNLLPLEIFSGFSINALLILASPHLNQKLKTKNRL
jgi:hypothetical protein